jgi:hypothetical protein
VLALRTVILELLAIPYLLLAALLSRGRRRPVTVGLGPDPNVGNLSLKQALLSGGVEAETYVQSVSHITDRFDVRSERFDLRGDRNDHFRRLRLFLYVLSRYRCLYLYFTGGPLSRGSILLWRLEPVLYRLAGIKVVMLAYGADVQDLTRSPNLLYKHAMSRDYPRHRHNRARIARSIDLWTRAADHVVGGCEWVDYLYHWDSLSLAHFTVDTEHWKPAEPARGPNSALRILHAPNHRAIKGTEYLERAVDRLRREGFAVELKILERVSNEEVRRALAGADLVVDQLVIGWYGLFALEAMATGVPALVYIRPDLEQFYQTVGLLEPGELPVVKAGPLDLEQVLRGLLQDRALLEEHAARSRSFVERHHSVAVQGRFLMALHELIGLAS